MANLQEHQAYTSIYPPIALGFFKQLLLLSTLCLVDLESPQSCSISLILKGVDTRKKTRPEPALLLVFYIHCCRNKCGSAHRSLRDVPPCSGSCRDTQPPTIPRFCSELPHSSSQPSCSWTRMMRSLSRRNICGALLVGVLLCTLLTLRIMGIQAPLGADRTFLKGWHFGHYWTPSFFGPTVRYMVRFASRYSYC